MSSDLLFVIPILTSVWVLFDAVVRRYLSFLRSVGWFLGCVLVWIVFFPLYLWKRGRPEFAGDKPKSTRRETIVGYSAVAVQLSIMVIYFTSSLTLSTAQLQDQVRKSIEQTYAKNPDTAKIKIQSMQLVHEQGSKYTGLLEVDDAGINEKYFIDVTYDGNRFIWQTRAAEGPNLSQALKQLSSVLEQTESKTP